ncbi:MAG: peptidylprolyl isomerase, partial [Sphingorhabdus sp.]
MNKCITTSAAVALLASLPLSAKAPENLPAPSEIVAAAKAQDWIAIAPSELLIMNLEADDRRRERRVVIQLIASPISQGWVENIRKLATARWWDGTAVVRVQDNYVTQWGDPTEKKALPDGLVT